MPDEPTTTADPDLHLRVDGRLVAPVHLEGATYRFELAATPTGAIRIVSRSVVPCDLDPSHPDSRRLGVSVLGLALLSEHVDVVLRHDDVDLIDGFHQVEDGYRWTDGDAGIPASLLSPFTGPLTVEVDIGTTGLQYVVQRGAVGDG